MVVGLEIVLQVHIAIKESSLPKVHLLPVICPTTCQLLNTLPVNLEQIKENVQLKGCFSLPPCKQICCFLFKYGRVDKDKRQRKIRRPAETSRKNLPNPLLLLLAIKEKIATIDVENWIFKIQLSQTVFKSDMTTLIFPPTLMSRSKSS